MDIILYLGLTVASAILYRIGGSDLNIPLKAKWRDWGCPACAILAMIAIRAGAPWWAHIVYFFPAWYGCASYNDHWGTDGVEWYEWLLTGVVMGLASLPYAFATGLWFAFWFQFIVQVGLFMAVRCGSKNVYVEECGSGASMIISKLAFLIKI